MMPAKHADIRVNGVKERASYDRSCTADKKSYWALNEREREKSSPKHVCEKVEKRRAIFYPFCNRCKRKKSFLLTWQKNVDFYRLFANLKCHQVFIPLFPSKMSSHWAFENGLVFCKSPYFDRIPYPRRWRPQIFMSERCTSGLCQGRIGLLQAFTVLGRSSDLSDHSTYLRQVFYEKYDLHESAQFTLTIGSSLVCSLLKLLLVFFV